MTDKEIIIDEVDVNRCAYITYRESNPICSETGMYCSGYDICYYKQLQRKKQECDHYKQVLEKIEEFVEPIYEQIPEDRVLRHILLLISEVKQ